MLFRACCLRATRAFFLWAVLAFTTLELTEPPLPFFLPDFGAAVFRATAGFFDAAAFFDAVALRAAAAAAVLVLVFLAVPPILLEFMVVRVFTIVCGDSVCTRDTI